MRRNRGRQSREREGEADRFNKESGREVRGYSHTSTHKHKTLDPHKNTRAAGTDPQPRHRHPSNHSLHPSRLDFDSENERFVHQSRTSRHTVEYDSIDLDNERTRDSQRTDIDKQTRHYGRVDPDKQTRHSSRNFSKKRFVPYCPSKSRNHSQSKLEQKAYSSMQTSANEKNFSNNFHQQADDKGFSSEFHDWIQGGGTPTEPRHTQSR